MKTLEIPSFERDNSRPMGIEAFPTIENFQKLPRQVIVKGGDSSFDAKTGAKLTGIVINNTGSSIRDVRVCVVIFDEKNIPQINLSTDADPQELSQGAIGSFGFHLENYPQEITNYYLYSKWRFDDRE